MHANVDTSIKKQKSKFKQFASRLKSIFNVAKKFIDDEIYYLFKPLFGGSLNKITESILMGSLMIFVFCQEGYGAIKDLIESLFNKEAEQRKTRVVTGSLILASALTGIGLIGALTAEAFGATVAGMVFMPVVLPAIMVGIYSLALTRRAYKLSVEKKKELEARALYEDELENNEIERQKLKFDLEELEDQYRKIQQQIDEYLKKSQTQIPTEEEAHQHISNLVTQLHVEEEIHKIEATQHVLDKRDETAKQTYQPYLDERLDAEREVAFATIELSTSAIILVSAILGASFIIGASVLSLGAVAFGLLLAGVCIAGAAKLFEWIDDETEHACTKWIRRLFTFGKHKQAIMYDYELQPCLMPTPTQPIPVPPSTTKELLSNMPQSEASRPLHFIEKDEINWQADYPNLSPPGYSQHRFFNSREVNERLFDSNCAEEATDYSNLQSPTNSY